MFAGLCPGNPQNGENLQKPPPGPTRKWGKLPPKKGRNFSETTIFVVVLRQFFPIFGGRNLSYFSESSAQEAFQGLCQGKTKGKVEEPVSAPEAWG